MDGFSGHSLQISRQVCFAATKRGAVFLIHAVYADFAAIQKCPDHSHMVSFDSGVVIAFSHPSLGS